MKRKFEAKSENNTNHAENNEQQQQQQSVPVDNAPDVSLFELAKSHEFKQLKQVKFRGISFTDEKIRSVLHILTKAEAVELYECTIRGEFYDKLLRYCPNINRLVVEPILNSSNSILGWDDRYERDLHSFIGTGNKWLLRQYPKLNYFGLHACTTNYQTAELKSFFRLNPNIRKLATYGDNLLWATDDWLFKSNLDLDELAIKPYDFESELWASLDHVVPKIKFAKRIQSYDHSGGTIIKECRHQFVPVELDKCYFGGGCALDNDCFPLVFSSFREMDNMLMPKKNVDQVVNTHLREMWDKLFEKKDQVLSTLMNLDFFCSSHTEGH